MVLSIGINRSQAHNRNPTSTITSIIVMIGIIYNFTSSHQYHASGRYRQAIIATDHLPQSTLYGYIIIAVNTIIVPEVTHTI